MKNTNNKGFTGFEILVVVSIMIVLFTIVMPSLVRFRRERTLSNTSEDIISILNKARNDTIGSLNSYAYGVHFQTDKITYFIAPTYTASISTNVIVNLDPNVTIPSSGGINLNGGGSDVIFTRLTGDTTYYGTIVVQITSDSTRTKTVTINKTGVASSN